MSYRVTADEATGKKHWFEHFSGCQFFLLRKTLRGIFGKNVVTSGFGKVIMIPKKDFWIGMKKLDAMTVEEFNKKYPRMQKAGYFKQDIVASLSCIQKDADKNSKFITLTRIV